MTTNMGKEKEKKLSILEENPIIAEDELGSFAVEELTDKSRKDHQSIVKTLDNQDNGLCVLILGAISLIVAGLFLILSFKRKANKPAGIDPLSLQFWVFVICAVGGLTLLVFGLVKVLVNRNVRIAYKKEIAAIAKTKDQMADNK